VLVVRHLNKAAANNPLYRGGGSIGIVGAARMAFVVGKDPQDENRRVMASTKNNLATAPPSLMFGLEEAESGSVKLEWLGRSEVSAKDLLATPQDREHSDARSEAVEFLEDILAEGPISSSQVKKEAEEAGISERTLARGKKSVGVIAFREGESGGRGKGQWLWKLPLFDLDDVKAATEPIKDANPALKQNVGILNHREGIEEEELPIDKPNSLRMPTTEDNPIKDANSIKDARVPTVGEVGTLKRDESEAVKAANGGSLKECGHGYPGGKGCYLCDPDHPYRKKVGTA
jgi:hypothetical protein